MKKTIITVMLSLVAFSVCDAQNFYSSSARKHNLYFKVITNAYHPVLLISEALVSNAANCLTGSDYFDFSARQAFLSTKADGEKLKTKLYSPNGFKANNLFNNFGGELRLGWQSYVPSMVNVGFYGIAGYNFDQFRIRTNWEDPEYFKHKMQHARVGGSVFFTFGRMEKGNRITVDLGARYNIASAYKGPFGDKTEVLNNGLSTHYEARWEGPKLTHNVKLYADIHHYNLLNEDKILETLKHDFGNKMRMWELGIAYSWTLGNAR